MKVASRVAMRILITEFARQRIDGRQLSIDGFGRLLKNSTLAGARLVRKNSGVKSEKRHSMRMTLSRRCVDDRRKRACYERLYVP